MNPFDKTKVEHADPEETWRCIEYRIKECTEITQDYFDSPDVQPVICFSHSDNFRKKLNPGYKSNREGVPKPILYADMVAKCKRLYKFEEWDNLEADDVMGLLQSDSTVICTGDKDLMQIPGFHLNLIDPEGGIFQTDKASGDHMFHVQCLSGDPVDGYGGCPKIGKKKAEAILEGEGSWWKLVVDTYKNAMSPKSITITSPSGKKRSKKIRSFNLGLGYKDALMTARMAYILRNEEDYNRETGEVNLWMP
jgi:DNA polymerase-1